MEDRLLDEKARSGRANLALVEENRVHNACQGKRKGNGKRTMKRKRTRKGKRTRMGKIRESGEEGLRGKRKRMNFKWKGEGMYTHTGTLTFDDRV